MINFTFQKKRNKTCEKDEKTNVLMILNKHTKENQLSQKSFNVCARNFHEAMLERCPWVNWIEKDNDRKHIWLRLDFMIDVSRVLPFFHSHKRWSLIKNEKRKSTKNILRLIDLWFRFYEFLLHQILLNRKI